MASSLDKQRAKALLDRAGHFANVEQEVLSQALMREWLDRVEECASA